MASSPEGRSQVSVNIIISTLLSNMKTWISLLLLDFPTDWALKRATLSDDSGVGRGTVIKWRCETGGTVAAVGEGELGDLLGRLSELGR